MSTPEAIKGSLIEPDLPDFPPVSHPDLSTHIPGPHFGIDNNGETVVASTGAIKNDGGKLRYDLIPPRALAAVTEILTLGSVKYSDRNWEKGFPWGRPFAATMRHLWAWWSGEDRDPETGCSHLAHALCNLFFLIEFETTHPELDDRPTTEK